MTENVETVTTEILRSTQGGVGDLRHELAELRSDMSQRFESIEDQLRKQRRNGAGMLVMMQATVGTFDERVQEIERRLERLEGAPQ